MLHQPTAQLLAEAMAENAALLKRRPAAVDDFGRPKKRRPRRE